MNRIGGISYSTSVLFVLWVYASGFYSIHSFLILTVSNQCHQRNLSTSLIMMKNIGLDIVTSGNNDPAKQAKCDTTPWNNKRKQNSIRIRRTQESDLGAIASFLSKTTTAATTTTSNDRSNPFQNWKQKIDLIWAKNDIEDLLRSRNRAIYAGIKSYESIRKRLNVDINESTPGFTDQDVLKYFWHHADSLRSMIEKSSKMTGEDNIWLHHKDIILTPASWQWLNHLQVTAYICDDETNNKEVIVGFCEVAMLVNPAPNQRMIQNAVDGNNDDEQHSIVWMGNIHQTNNLVAFSPAITNLATSVPYRRRGVGTHLLKFVEKYCQTYWGTLHLGLYVEKSNEAAMLLYTNKLQYQPIYSCAATERVGAMWYMSKQLTNPGGNTRQRRQNVDVNFQVNDVKINEIRPIANISDNNVLTEVYEPMDYSVPSGTMNKDIELFTFEAEYHPTNSKNAESRNVSLIEEEIVVRFERCR